MPLSIRRQQTRDVQHPYVYRRLYAVDCLPDSVQQAERLEALRYKWGRYRYGARLIQRLGNVGRRLAWVPAVSALWWLLRH